MWLSDPSFVVRRLQFAIYVRYINRHMLVYVFYFEENIDVNYTRTHLVVDLERCFVNVIYDYKYDEKLALSPDSIRKQT